MDKFITRSFSNPSLAAKRPIETDVIDHNVWNLPKRPARPTRLQPEVPVNTTNRFSKLPTEHVFSDSLPKHTCSSTTATTKKVGKIPPIFITLKPEWTHSYMKTMISRYTKGFHLEYKGNNKISINPHTSDGHQALKEGLRSESIPYHTFSRKDERMPRAVVFGLPDYVEEHLAEELSSIGFPNAKVRKMKVAEGRDASCPPYLVQLQAGVDISKFKSIKYISNCAVRIVKFRNKNMYGTQCYRCQAFGHSSKNCNLKPRCVKCPEGHLTTECPKSNRMEPAKCCNCGEDHPANFRHCKERQNYLQLLQARQDKIKAAHEQRQTKIFSKVDGRSWATIASITDKDLKTQTSHDAPLDQTTLEMLGILKTIKSIKDQFSVCDNMMDKVILILTHLGHYV